MNEKKVDEGEKEVDVPKETDTKTGPHEKILERTEKAPEPLPAESDPAIPKFFK